MGCTGNFGSISGVKNTFACEMLDFLFEIAARPGGSLQKVGKLGYANFSRHGPTVP